MLKLSKTHDTLRVVDDQIGLPTYTRDLSELLCDMLETEKYGTYHACNTGDYISWYDFASEILKDTGVKVIPVSTEEYGVSTAARPKNSRLDTSKLTENGFRQLPEWKDALERYMKEVKQYGTD
jgi:dTDP-4-dehydrorhamnose reductase